jgi:hypothetical protein
MLIRVRNSSERKTIQIDKKMQIASKILSYPILFFLRRNTTLDNVIKIKERPADGK